MRNKIGAAVLVLVLGVIGLDIAGTGLLNNEARYRWCLVTADKAYCDSPEFSRMIPEKMYRERVAEDKRRWAEEEKRRQAAAARQREVQAAQRSMSQAYSGSGLPFNEQDCRVGIVNQVVNGRNARGEATSSTEYEALEKIAAASCSPSGRNVVNGAAEAAEIVKDVGAIAREGASALREFIRRP